MRRRLSRGVSLTALAAAAFLTTIPASAQRAKKPKAAPAAASTAAPVDMDADASSKATGKKGAPAKGAKGSNAPGDSGGTPTPGTPSEAAAQAKHLYETEKWWDAAQALFAVSNGETGDDEGNKQLAQFNLAKSLYKLKFYQAAYSIFSEIADKPNHLKFSETLLWLAKLATDLPEPADIIERVGKYNDGQIARFNNPEQQELYWQLNYLLGRYKYRNGQYPEALAPVRKGEPREQVLRPSAVLWRHLERPDAPEQAGRAVVPARSRRYRRGRRGGDGR